MTADRQDIVERLYSLRHRTHAPDEAFVAMQDAEWTITALRAERDTLRAELAATEAARVGTVEEFRRFRNGQWKHLYERMEKAEAALLAANEEIERHLKAAGFWRTGEAVQHAANVALRAENDALRKDAERYRWWRARFLRMLTGDDPDIFEKETTVWDKHCRPTNETEFDAITDAALANRPAEP